MDDLNFDNIEDYEEYPILKEGTYLCKLVNIHDRATNAGDQMWGLEFMVMDEGANQGRKVFDNMVFSEKALSRVKLIASRLGVKTQGKMNLSELKSQILDKCVYIEVEEGEYIHNNKPRKQNTVPYNGYTEIKEKGKSKQVEEEDIEDDAPF